MSDAEQKVAEPVEQKEAWPRVLKLKDPIQFGTDLVTELEFQRGTLGAIKGMKLSSIDDVNSLMLVASRLCAKPLAVIERLSPEDAEEVTAIAMRFFVKCLPNMNPG